MTRTQTKNPEVTRIIEKYGQGFDVIYFDGKADGFKDGKAKGRLDTAKNLLAAGVDEKIISQCTGIPINELKKLKKEL